MFFITLGQVYTGREIFVHPMFIKRGKVKNWVSSGFLEEWGLFPCVNKEQKAFVQMTFFTYRSLAHIDVWIFDSFDRKSYVFLKLDSFNGVFCKEHSKSLECGWWVVLTCLMRFVLKKKKDLRIKFVYQIYQPRADKFPWTRDSVLKLGKSEYSRMTWSPYSRCRLHIGSFKVQPPDSNVYISK